MNGAMAEDSWYIQQRYSGGEALQNDWDRLDLDARIAAPDVRTATDGVFTYTLKTSVYVDNVLAQYASAIKGGAGLVWGSESSFRPVLEAGSSTNVESVLAPGALPTWPLVPARL